MTYSEKEKYEAKEKRLTLAAYSAARQAAAEGTTYSEAIQILERAKDILQVNMRKQRAAVPLEVRDRWGNIIDTLDAGEVADTAIER